MYSSPIAFPVFDTIDSLSPSGSVAKPISAPTSKTFFSKSFKFSARGSATRVKFPSPAQFIISMSHPKSLHSCGKILDAPPLTASITTLKFLERMLLTLMDFASKTLEICS